MAGRIPTACRLFRLSLGQLKSALLNKAQEYSLPVKDDDISITTTGAVFRVAVDYRVPIDLFVYSPRLTFHTIGAGLLRE